MWSFAVQFSEPQAHMSDDQKLDNIQKRLDMGLITKVEAIMKDRDVDEDKAREILENIDDEQIDPVRDMLVGNREQEA